MQMFSCICLLALRHRHTFGENKRAEGSELVDICSGWPSTTDTHSGSPRQGVKDNLNGRLESLEYAEDALDEIANTHTQYLSTYRGHQAIRHELENLRYLST